MWHSDPALCSDWPGVQQAELRRDLPKKIVQWAGAAHWPRPTLSGPSVQTGHRDHAGWRKWHLGTFFFNSMVSYKVKIWLCCSNYTKQLNEVIDSWCRKITLGTKHTLNQLHFSLDVKVNWFKPSINTAGIYCSVYRVEGVCLLAGSGQDGPVGVFVC